MPVKLKKEEVFKIIESEDYEVQSSEYVNNRTDLSIKHLKCDNIFSMDFDHWKRGQRCPKCNKESQKKTPDQFREELEKNVPGKYTLLEEYTNKNTKIKVICNECNNIMSIIPKGLLQGNCVHCGKMHKNEKLKLKNDIVEEQIKKSGFELISEYENNKKPLKLKCSTCGNIMLCGLQNLRAGQKCPICYLCSSKKEEELRDYIKTLDPNIKKHKIYIDPNNTHLYKEIDCYSEERKIGVEFDGLYWHSDVKLNSTYHSNKTDLCNKNGIQLIHIFEDEWDNKKEIVKDKLKSIFGKIDNKIYARKCVVKEISTKDKNEFLKNTHIQGPDNSNIKLGLLYNDEIVAVMTFGKLRRNLGNVKNIKGTYELVRYSGKLNTTIVGGFSKLLKYAEENYDIKKIITYADIRYSKLNSNVYQNNGFVFSHRSQNNYYYLDSNCKERKNRFNFRKSKLKDLFPEIYSDDKSESEIMKEAGYHKIYDCGNLVYIKEVKGE